MFPSGRRTDDDVRRWKRRVSWLISKAQVVGFWFVDKLPLQVALELASFNYPNADPCILMILTCIFINCDGYSASSCLDQLAMFFLCKVCQWAGLKTRSFYIPFFRIVMPKRSHHFGWKRVVFRCVISQFDRQRVTLRTVPCRVLLWPKMRTPPRLQPR